MHSVPTRGFLSALTALLVCGPVASQPGTQNANEQRFSGTGRAHSAASLVLDLHYIKSDAPLAPIRTWRFAAVNSLPLTGVIPTVTDEESAFMLDERTSGAFRPPVRSQRYPQLARLVRDYRRNGLPVARLWASGHGLLAIGLSPRGVPGLYFTHAFEK